MGTPRVPASSVLSASTTPTTPTVSPSSAAPANERRYLVSPQTSYDIMNIIGTGAYGSVYEAYDRSARQWVAVKRVRHVFRDLVDCRRTLREISILAELSHACVVRLHDVFFSGDVSSFDELYIVMEICQSDLRSLCATEAILSAMHVNMIMYRLLLGLQYIHAVGIYHRDLKPANCLVNQDCTVKICDFGLSRVVGVSQLSPAAEDEVPSGGRGRCLTNHVATRWYRAPELILMQENYTEAIDVWSAACVYAEMLHTLPGGPLPEDREALFPGASCFPLSPASFHNPEGGLPGFSGSGDQLSTIFHVLGMPSLTDVKGLDRRDAQQYVLSFAATPGVNEDSAGLESRLPHVEAPAIDILRRMLRFNAQERLKVADALRHDVFVEIRQVLPEKEVASSCVRLPPEVFDFEEHALTQEQLRSCLGRATDRWQARRQPPSSAAQPGPVVEEDTPSLVPASCDESEAALAPAAIDAVEGAGAGAADNVVPAFEYAKASMNEKVVDVNVFDQTYAPLGA